MVNALVCGTRYEGSIPFGPPNFKKGEEIEKSDW